MSNIRPVSLEEFLRKDIPASQLFLGDWLEEGMPVLVAGEAGVGKSHFVYWLAYAIATGTEYLCWKAPHVCPVGLLDGEMRDSTIQERLATIVNSTGKTTENFRIVTRDMFKESQERIPYLRDPHDRQRTLDMFEGVRVLVVDNLNCFFGGGNENSSEFWDDIERFTFDCRDRGISLIMVHHASKSNSGSPAGNSKNVRLPEVVIVLSSVDDAQRGGGAHFRVQFQKTRGVLVGPVDFEAQLLSGEDGKHYWEIDSDQRSSRDAKILELRAQGKTQRQVAEQLNISHVTVGRVEQEAPGQVNFWPDGSI